MYSINIPVESFSGYSVQGNYLFRKEKIDAKDWVPGMPSFLDIPMSCPTISHVEYKENVIVLHFSLKTEEEKKAWPHTKKFLSELFGIKGSVITELELLSHQEILVRGFGILDEMLGSFHRAICREIPKYASPKRRQELRIQRIQNIRDFQTSCFRNLVYYESILNSDRSLPENITSRIREVISILEHSLTMY